MRKFPTLDPGAGRARKAWSLAAAMTVALTVLLGAGVAPSVGDAAPALRAAGASLLNLMADATNAVPAFSTARVKI